LGVYQAGERPMADIDLLARAPDVEAVSRSLEELGYRHLYSSSRHGVFKAATPARAVVFGEHIDNPLKIELHTEITERLPVSEVSITSDLWPRITVAGISRYSSAAALMKHLLLHAAGSMRARALRGIQLHDIALLAKRMSDDDWRWLAGGAAASRW